MHWILIIFELAGPLIVGVQLLPMAAQAKIKYVYDISKIKEQAKKYTSVADEESDGDSPVKKHRDAPKRKSKKG